LRPLLIAAVYAMVAVIPMSPWLAKNYVETGNPTFPLFHGIFGGRTQPDRGAGIDVFTRRRLLYGESWSGSPPSRCACSPPVARAIREIRWCPCPLMLLGIAAAPPPRTARAAPAARLAATYFGIASSRRVCGPATSCRSRRWR
jgi:hypothetical protein